MTTDALRSAHLRGADDITLPAGPATTTLATAFALGVAGDLLLRAGTPGLGFGIWIAGILLALDMLSRRHGVEWHTEHWLLVIPALFFGESLAWRDAGPLGAFNLLATALALAVLSLSLAAGGRWRAAEAKLRDYLFACFASGVNAAAHVIPLALDAAAEDGERQRGRTRALGGVARGLFFALPLLLVFGALLTSADPVFARLVAEAVDIDFETLISHLVLAGVLTWVLGGWLRGTLLAPAPARLGLLPEVRGFRLGIVETTTVLGMVNLLFLAFVLVQVRYLFGGAALVQVTPGVSFADYARRGFFELVFVTLLVLPMLLGTHAFLRRERARDVRIWRVLAASTLVLLTVIVASAVERMRLYVSAYGLTDDRLYALAFMAWLGVVFALFAVTVLRDRVRRFAIGALASGWTVLAALNLANPDALIARVNLSRLDAAERLDGVYLAGLGADAMPVILPRFASLPEAQRCAISAVVLRRYVDQPEGDWRSWNRGRARARQLAAEHTGQLRDTQLACVRAARDRRASAMKMATASPATTAASPLSGANVPSPRD